MKRTLSMLIALLLCLSVFVGCDNRENIECKHNWLLLPASENEYKCADCNETHLCDNPEDLERVGNLNESTLIFKCRICGSEHLTTDPDSIHEEHNWQIVNQDDGCWYSIITYACSNCDMEQTAEADLALPNHNWAEETADGKTTFTCTRCKESNTFISEIREFSYAQALEEYMIGDPGVKHENFNNPAVESEITGAIDAIIRAKFELTIEYDTISVSFDEISNMWRVDFWTLNMDGGGQSVYVNNQGLTCYVVYGE